MNLFKSRSKILLILVPIVLFVLSSELNSGNLAIPWIKGPSAQKKMTKEEFDKLPDDHVFTYKGRKITKAQILSRFNNMQRKSRRVGNPIAPAELKAMSEIEHQEMVRKDNMKVMEHIKRQFKSERPQRMVESQRPGITSTFSVPPLSPGEDIFIKGYGFKEENLKVQLLGDFPGGRLNLRVMDLKPNYIHARVNDVEGAPDQAAKLAVSVAGFESNHWPITFEAKRVLRMLASKDYIVLFCHPGFPRSGDICNTLASNGHGGSGIFRTEHFYSSMEIGEDIVIAELKNGWHFKELSYIKWYQAKLPYGPNAQLAWVDGFNPMSQSLKLNIGWMYIGAGGISYEIGIFIIGPAGIPYN
jgi:hypothetical protein